MTLSLLSRSLSELVHIARLNFPVYQEPIKSGECRVSDTKKLWANI